MSEQDILKEFEAHFNEPVLMYDRLARVIGYGEDDCDCYLIVQYLGGKVVWNTAVGGYFWLDKLKEQGKVISTDGEQWSDFTRLEHHLTLSGAPPREEFLVKRYTAPSPSGDRE